MYNTDIFTEEIGVHTKKNSAEVRHNDELGISVRAIQNEDGSISINAEDTAIGFGWTQEKGNKTYVRWETLNGYLKDLGFSQEVGKEDYIPESLFYMLGFKAGNERAVKFQKWLATEVLPSIRKNGIYATDNVIDRILNNPDFGIELLTKLKEERHARLKAEKRNAILMHVNKTYTMTEIAKELGLKSAVELNKKLAELHIQYKVNNTWVMYSDYSNLRYEEIKQEVLDNGAVVYHRRITQSGREFILNLINSKAS
ncbi:phage antirepressor KilAC domain-containing protein [Lacrimispora sp.]|uniref:phage antirepressor KilAC domain-containing protein n=1 Tax=Lacrimispora sp. TaxID=2719234 RepID=UPI0028A86D02|nr:phage antirepressor KilAC domain-containing protein [Lacrimispora sp.]